MKPRAPAWIALSAALFLSPAGTAGIPPDSARGGPFRLFPGGLLVAPIPAHHPESRLGLRKETGSSRMRLDVACTMDILEYTPDEGEEGAFRFGIDFGVHALTTSSQGFRLQVDAADGLFGGHLSALVPGTGGAAALRLRVAHLSGHFVDGHYDETTRSWKGGRDPLPFTRDFGELVTLYRTGPRPPAPVLWGGFGYAALVRPDRMGRTEYACGAYTHIPLAEGRVLGSAAWLYAAYALTLRGVPAYRGTHRMEGGLKLGDPGGPGLRLWTGWQTGLDDLAQYFDAPASSWGVGFSFEPL
ncbi:MAG: hypothetical protein WB626_04215 [Bacteroidota bacterium]